MNRLYKNVFGHDKIINSYIKANEEIHLKWINENNIKSKKEFNTFENKPNFIHKEFRKLIKSCPDILKKLGWKGDIKYHYKWIKENKIRSKRQYNKFKNKPDDIYDNYKDLSKSFNKDISFELRWLDCDKILREDYHLYFIKSECINSKSEYDKFQKKHKYGTYYKTAEELEYNFPNFFKRNCLVDFLDLEGHVKWILENNIKSAEEYNNFEIKPENIFDKLYFKNKFHSEIKKRLGWIGVNFYSSDDYIEWMEDNYINSVIKYDINEDKPIGFYKKYKDLVLAHPCIEDAYSFLSFSKSDKINKFKDMYIISFGEEENIRGKIFGNDTWKNKKEKSERFIFKKNYSEADYVWMLDYYDIKDYSKWYKLFEQRGLEDKGFNKLFFRYFGYESIPSFRWDNRYF